jgi:hypothetical protein
VVEGKQGQLHARTNGGVLEGFRLPHMWLELQSRGIDWPIAPEQENIEVWLE